MNTKIEFDFVMKLNECNNSKDIFNMLTRILMYYRNKPLTINNFTKNDIVDDDQIFYIRLQIVQEWSCINKNVL